MGVLLDTELALQSRLATINPAVSIAWPNVKFDSTENTAYIRPTILPAKGLPATMAGGIIHMGIFQVDVFVPLEKGISALLAILDNIYTLYKNVTLTKNTTTVRCDGVSRGRGVSDDTFYSGFIAIDYVCFDA